MIQTTTEFFEQGNFNNTIDMLNEFAEMRIKQLQIFTVKIQGSLYDETYSENEYIGFSEEEAQEVIFKNKGRYLQNGGNMYAYLQTWENNLKINEKEIEL